MPLPTALVGGKPLKPGAMVIVVVAVLAFVLLGILLCFFLIDTLRKDDNTRTSGPGSGSRAGDESESQHAGSGDGIVVPQGYANTATITSEFSFAHGTPVPTEGAVRHLVVDLYASDGIVEGDIKTISISVRTLGSGSAESESIEVVVTFTLDVTRLAYASTPALESAVRATGGDAATTITDIRSATARLRNTLQDTTLLTVDDGTLTNRAVTYFGVGSVLATTFSNLYTASLVYQVARNPPLEVTADFYVNTSVAAAHINDGSAYTTFRATVPGDLGRLYQTILEDGTVPSVQARQVVEGQVVVVTTALRSNKYTSGARFVAAVEAQTRTVLQDGTLVALFERILPALDGERTLSGLAEAVVREDLPETADYPAVTIASAFILDDVDAAQVDESDLIYLGDLVFDTLAADHIVTDRAQIENVAVAPLPEPSQLRTGQEAGDLVSIKVTFGITLAPEAVAERVSAPAVSGSGSESGSTESESSVMDSGHLGSFVQALERDIEEIIVDALREGGDIAQRLDDLQGTGGSGSGSGSESASPFALANPNIEATEAAIQSETTSTTEYESAAERPTLRLDFHFGLLGLGIVSAIDRQNTLTALANLFTRNGILYMSTNDLEILAIESTDNSKVIRCIHEVPDVVLKDLLEEEGGRLWTQGTVVDIAGAIDSSINESIFGDDGRGLLGALAEVDSTGVFTGVTLDLGSGTGGTTTRSGGGFVIVYDSQSISASVMDSASASTSSSDSASASASTSSSDSASASASASTSSSDSTSNSASASTSNSASASASTSSSDSTSNSDSHSASGSESSSNSVSASDSESPSASAS